MTWNIPSLSKSKAGKNTVAEYVEDDVYEFPDSGLGMPPGEYLINR